ncbi:uncharacterized protein BcabD6B2_44390 [Babesia caballi]|uniref:Nucleolar protein 16 n=1 Tax=Babesia caballi TaxID=5871 RepID=A0AAV4LY39_BABCB|nr:hypothetical protein, conserved [Babesia caballi]
MKLRRNRLLRLKSLALYAGRTPAQVKLDRLWGFKPEKVVRQKARRKSRSKVGKDLIIGKDSVEDTFASLEKIEEPASVGFKEAEGEAEDKGTAYRRRPWQPDPEVQKQKRMFKETVKELHNLVYPHLDPIAKRHYDDAKLRALGGKISKNRKMPYKELQQRMRGLKRNVEKNQKLEKELGVKMFSDTMGGTRFAELQKRYAKC